MKFAILALAVSATLVASAASAQTYGGSQYRSRPLDGTLHTQPQTTRSYDWQSGNSYTTHRQYDGSARINGMNTNTGSTWSTTVKPNGDMNGVDANGNYWNYNARSKSYYNSDGTTCYGEGENRTCY